MSRHSLLRLLISVSGTFLVAVGGSLITTANLSPWYESLQKPSWIPPSEVFGPVWTVLYLLMAVAAFLVWEKGCHKRLVQAGLSIYLLQLGLNFAWSLVFFGFHDLGAAVAEILILLLFVLATIAVFWRSSKTAAMLLVPYLLWVLFATALTIAVWQLNSSFA